MVLLVDLIQVVHTTPLLLVTHEEELYLPLVPMVSPVLMEASVKSVLVVVHSELVHAVVPLEAVVAASVAVA